MTKTEQHKRRLALQEAMKYLTARNYRNRTGQDLDMKQCELIQSVIEAIAEILVYTEAKADEQR